MYNTCKPHSHSIQDSRRGRKPRRLHRLRTTSTALVVALGFVATSPAFAAAGQPSDVRLVDPNTGYVIAAQESRDVAVERMLFDMAADLPLDHVPAIPIDSSLQDHSNDANDRELADSNADLPLDNAPTDT